LLSDLHFFPTRRSSDLITPAPSLRAQRTASRKPSGLSGSQLAKSNCASGAMLCTTSPQSMPCWLSFASRLPSRRKECTLTFLGRSEEHTSELQSPDHLV